MLGQLSLFPEARIRSVEHDALDVPGLTYARGVLEPDVEVRLLGEVDAQPWLDDLKRRVQHYGYRYDYKARRINPSMFVGPLPPFALEVAGRLLEWELLHRLPDQMIVNEYLPGQGISAHIDCEPCFDDRIVTVSLGSDCEMDFIHATTDETRSLVLERGSALLLSGPARYEWQHQIRPRRKDHGVPRQRRVSLTFRNVILDSSASDGELEAQPRACDLSI